jgi:GDP-4-dehydro-6-deoxy-D-mannose reductase
MDVRFSRSFNHTGPGQAPRFVCSDWARQVAAIELKLQKPEITVGDIRLCIDFSDVRDVSRAYQTILDKGEKGGMYNVCSGMPVSLEHILGHLTAKCARKVRITSTAFKSRDHAASPRLAGDNGRLRKLGWKPRFTIEDTLDDLFAYWMRELAGRKFTT